MNNTNETKCYHIVWRQKKTGLIHTDKFVKAKQFGRVLDCATDVKFHVDVTAEIWELKDEIKVPAKMAREELEKIWSTQ